MAEKRLADRRIYGIDPYGREVLIAVKGGPLPDWYVEPEPEPEPGKHVDPPGAGAGEAKVERRPKRAARAKGRPPTK